MAFMERLTAPVLDCEGRQELLAKFDLLSGLAFNSRQDGSRQSQLCYDGTPIEMSVTLDDAARVGVRFVADVAGGLPPIEQEERPQQFRRLADLVVPAFPGSEELLDRTFALHLAGRLPASRFLVWFGSGAARGKKTLGKVYFNTEWLSPSALRHTLEPHMPPEALEIAPSLPAVTSSYYKCVAYDFDSDGLRNIKLYLQPRQEDPASLFDLFEAFPEARDGRLRSLFEIFFGKGSASTGCPCALVLGVKLGPGGSLAGFEPKVYVNLFNWGYRTFAEVGPLLHRLLDHWGYSADFLNERGPQGFEPTLAGIAVSASREGVALYFKPIPPYAYR